MDYLTAHEMFAQRDLSGDRSSFNAEVFVDTQTGSADCWAAGAVAAVSCAGCLEDAQSWEDLEEGISHFGYLITDSITQNAEWEAETSRVVDAVIQWGMAQESAAMA